MIKVLQKYRRTGWSLQKIGVITFLLISSLTICAQQKKIVVKGRVLDDKTNEAIIGAAIKIRGLEKEIQIGTVSDVNGNFSIDVKSFPVTLSISYLGYQGQEFDIYEYTVPVTLYLSQNLNSLNEVVVVGYGTQKRKELTGSISSIPDNLLKQPVLSFDQLIGGAVPGLVVNQNSGQPGASSTIRIRGGNSINGGNEPLYVIDGFIVYNDNSNSKTSEAKTNLVSNADANLNLLSTINPSDIESVEVLKDASATAVYGTRGANGVIIITTKKGKKGSNNVSYQSTFGWSEIAKKPNLLNGQQWWSLYKTIVPQSDWKDPSKDGFDPTKTFDWVGAALRKGLTQDHQISISGGDAKSRYAVSGNYTSQDGILKNTGYERYSFRANLEKDVYKNFRFGINAIGSHSKQNTLGSLSNDNVVNTWVSLLRSSPVVPIYNADGTFNYNNPFSVNAQENALADLLTTTSETKVNRVLGNFFAEYKILPSLTAKVNLGTDLLGSDQNYFAPANSGGGRQTNGYATKGSKTVDSWQSEFTLNYDKTFDNIHHVGALLGYTFQRSDMEYSEAISTNFLNETTTYNSLQSGSASTPYSGAQTDVLISYLGRINYTLLDRYNLTTTLRADGSSRFGSNNHWGYFPSLGLSWNANDEKFLKGYKDLSNLKLRISAGSTGNQEIPAYLYESTLEPQTYSYGGTVVTGYASTITKYNPDLKWERTAQYDAGFDLGLWKDRLTLTFDAYYKKTSDLLLLLPVQVATGYENTYSNIGAVSNKGVELGLNVQVIKSKDFNWSSVLTWSSNKNEVLNLGGLDQIQPEFPVAGALSTVYPTIVKPGLPLGTFYGYQFAGVVQKGDDLTKIAAPSWITGYTAQPGDPKFVDQNGDGKITPEDKVILGNAQPKFTLGFNNSFTYKKFDLSFYIAVSYGNKLYNALENKLELVNRTYNSSAILANSWTTTNASTTVPRAYEASTFNMDSRYIEDASYLKLKNLSIGYTFPFRVKGVDNKSSLRIFATAQNLLTLTKYSGFDPESSRVGNSSYEQSPLYQGVDYGAYPSSKTFLLGLNINL